MAKPYSFDLRSRVVASVTSGRTCRVTAGLFGVSVASVVRWSQRYRATGSAVAKKMGGNRPRRLAGEEEWLKALIAVKPDLTLKAMLAALVERGKVVSYGALWKFLDDEGISFKKKRPRRRAGAARRRSTAGPVEEVSRAD